MTGRGTVALGNYPGGMRSVVITDATLRYVTSARPNRTRSPSASGVGSVTRCSFTHVPF
jgi:hypothetical protein